MTQDWATPTRAFDVLNQQKRRGDIEVRRPTIRQASDLVGPGIGATAVRLDDYNDLLATFNGYYASEVGAANAPAPDEAFIGQVVSDALLGGRQVFTGLTSGTEYSRVFTRAPSDPEWIEWGEWTGQRVLPTVSGFSVVLTPVPHATATTLRPPALEGNEDIHSVFGSNAVNIFAARQGVYTGNIRVGSIPGVTANVTVRRPDGAAIESVDYGSVSLGGAGFLIPFTCWAQDGSMGFSVDVLQNSGATAEAWWQFQATRLGDAI